MLIYKGFMGQVTFDEEAKILFGRVVNTRDVITFQSTSADTIEQEFHDSVEEYLAFCQELGREPEKPYSGKFVLRLAPEDHKKVSLAAWKANKSLNAWITEQLIKSADAALTLS
jgi:predicted HicB family RNase H-like nuclease